MTSGTAGVLPSACAFGRSLFMPQSSSARVSTSNTKSPGVLAESYHSELVNAIKANDYRYQNGRLTVFLAREFGFCYGVDRAVDYAYQARRRFPDRRVFLTGEIIHNPHVNDQLRAQGIRFLSDPGRGRRRHAGRRGRSCRRLG